MIGISWLGGPAPVWRLLSRDCRRSGNSLYSGFQLLRARTQLPARPPPPRPAPPHGGLRFPEAPGRRGGRRAGCLSMATGELGSRSAEKLFSLSGLFAVYKPKGRTSAAVLNLLKERLLAGRRAVGLGDLRAPSWVLRSSCKSLLSVSVCRSRRASKR